MIKSCALFLMGIALAGSTACNLCISTTIPKDIVPVRCESGPVMKHSLPQEASADKNKIESSLTRDVTQTTPTSMKLAKGGDDEDEDDKDGGKDKEDGAERLWDSVMLG